jgi:DegV family protein with EDD domain
MPIRIVTDSTCDLPDEIIKQYEIVVVPVYVNLGEKSYQDGVDLNRQEFYSTLESSRIIPTTSSPSIDSFINVFTNLVNMGADAILSIHVSSKVSGVFDVASLATKSFKQGLVRSFDTGQISLGTGFIVAVAAKMAQTGKSLQEIISGIQDLVERTYTFAIVDNLKFLQHSGRISQFKTMLGSLLHLKPLLRFHKGIASVSISRTTNSAIKHLRSAITSLGQLEKINVLHINAPENANQLKEILTKDFPGLSGTIATDVDPAIGAHIGPGAVGIAAIFASPQK